MNPIALAGLQGLFKGLLLPAGAPSRGFGDIVGAAAREEVEFRALPFMLAGASGVAPPRGFTAGAFALAHLLGERHSVTSGVARFADVFLGGLLYEDAYRSHGFAGAVAAHALHNIAVQLGGIRRRSVAAPEALGRLSYCGRSTRPKRRSHRRK